MMKFVFALIVACIIIGCGTSSPRFREESSHPAKTEKPEHRTDGVRFTSKHVEEEIKEDDRKVDVLSVVKRFSSSSTEKADQPLGKKSEPKANPDSHENSSESIAAPLNKQKMMDVILSYLGTPYKYGGETKDGIDCSAFTGQVYDQSVHITLPRSTDAQINKGTPVSYDGLHFGDLLFFNTTGRNPSHVGIYIGDGLFAHASEAFGVTISSLESLYYKKHYTEARRIIQ
jgi:cell wall-associated NlpC family hydrolase